MLWKDSRKHLRDVTIFAGRARMHRGEFYKNIFTKRSTLSTWEFKDTALLKQIAASNSARHQAKTFFICIALFTRDNDVRAKFGKIKVTSNIRNERHEIPISNKWKSTRGLDRPPLHDRGLRLNPEILSSVSSIRPSVPLNWNDFALAKRRVL